MKNTVFVVCLCLLVCVGTSWGFNSRVNGEACVPCERHVRCQSLARFDDCEIVRRPCGCCDECARQMGEYCSAVSPRCARGLMCMNSRGETLERVPWIMKKYHGICQNVVVQPVVEENYDVDDRRIGSRHEKNRV